MNHMKSFSNIPSDLVKGKIHLHLTPTPTPTQTPTQTQRDHDERKTGTSVQEVKHENGFRLSLGCSGSFDACIDQRDGGSFRVQSFHR